MASVVGVGWGVFLAPFQHAAGVWFDFIRWWDGCLCHARTIVFLVPFVWLLLLTRVVASIFVFVLSISFVL